MSGKTGVATTCNICGETYIGLALDCKCTQQYLAELDAKLKKIPDGEDRPLLTSNKPSKIGTMLSQNRMAIAGAVEDLAWSYVHAYVAILRDKALLTEKQILDTLGDLDESLQAPNPDHTRP